MNLTNYEQTSIAAVFEAVRQKAAARGVEILSSEIIGLVPQKALIDVAAAHLKLEDFSHDRILENKLAELEKHGTVRPVTLTATPKGPETVPPTPPKLPLRAEVQTLLNAIAAPTPTPAGGSVSALSGACAAALGEMICRIILRRCDAQSRPPLEEILRKLTALRGELAQAFDADATAFNAVMAAYALRRETAAEIKQREAAIEKAMKGAVRVPLTVSKKSLETLELLQQLQGQAAGGVASDLAVAEQMAHAAAVGALTTVKSNLGSIHDETFVASVRREMTALE
jgi:formiminotetrahydrofolate cyclodeaminase